MSSLIGAHFRSNGIKQFPARVVFSLNGNGLGGDEIHPNTITIVRDTRVFPDGEAPPDFNTFDPAVSGISWEEYGEYWFKKRGEAEGGNFKSAWARNPADYYQICNEQGGNSVEALKQVVNIERAISRAASKEGIKCCIMNLAGGSPGDFSLWAEIVAPFIVEAWKQGGHIYGRHIYGQSDSDENGEEIPFTGNLVNSDGTVKPGQPMRVIQELTYLRRLGYGGGVVLTECGLDGGYGVVNLERFLFQIKAYEKALRPFSERLIGLCWWECGNSEFEADYTNHLKELIPYMTNEAALGKWQAIPHAPTSGSSSSDTTLSSATHIGNGNIDMIQYFTPKSGTYGDITIKSTNWGQGDVRQQLQQHDGYLYVTKGHEFEKRQLDGNVIRFLLDNSPGDGKYYTVESPTGWIPASWRIGDVFYREEKATFFFKSNGQPTGQVLASSNIMKFYALYPNWTSIHGINFKNVAHLQWVLNGRVEEEYWLAPHIGYVGWKNKSGKASWIKEHIPRGNQGNNQFPGGVYHHSFGE